MSYLLAIQHSGGGGGTSITYTLSADTIHKTIVLTPSTGDAQVVTVPYATDASTINGHSVPELENGKIPASYLPSYVDDVLEYSSSSDFPSEGESSKIYIDLTTNKIYRWGGSTYAEISESLALGETSSTAYRGDRGKTAYDHSQIASGNPHGTTLADLNGDSTHRTVTDDEKTTWNGKADVSDIPTDAEDLDYDNTTSGLTATDVQNAIDEIARNGGGHTYDDEEKLIGDWFGKDLYEKTYHITDLSSNEFYVNLNITGNYEITNFWGICKGTYNVIKAPIYINNANEVRIYIYDKDSTSASSDIGKAFIHLGTDIPTYYDEIYLTVQYIKEASSSYLYDWDFTQSLIDANGTDAIFYTDVEDPTSGTTTPDTGEWETMRGIKVLNNSPLAIPVDLLSKTHSYAVEIDFNTFSLGMSSWTTGFLMNIASSAWTNSITSGLCSDFQGDFIVTTYDDNGNFHTSETSTITQHYFENSTMKIVNRLTTNNNVVWDFYKDDVLVFTTDEYQSDGETPVFWDNSVLQSPFAISGKSGEFSGYITGMRISLVE